MISKNANCLKNKQLAFKEVLEAGLEPAQPQWSRDFKSLVSTIPPFEQPVFILLQGKQELLFHYNLAKVSSFAINSKEICNNL